MGLEADRDRFHPSGRRVDRINDTVEASRQPQPMSIGADIAHVGTAAAGNWPHRFELPRGEINHRNAALAMRTNCSMRAAIGDIKLPSIAADTQAVSPNPSRDKADFSEAVAVD